ncbi:helix-turn-helix domain-containing protein [Lactococcus lactis]|uniref:helix-turn-helix domain-containing protein n=1 Tax=Lactococcus lactis TaxID=1358 RepID=UPI00325E9D70
MAKNRIKELRKAQNLTLNNLVDLLAKKGIKVNESQLSKFEKGTSSPRNEETWEALAEIFDVSLAYVTGYDIDSQKFTESLDFLNSQTKILSDEYKKDTGKAKNPTIKELRQYVNDNQERKINEDIKQLNNISYNLNEINRKKLIEYAKDLSKLQNFEKEKTEDKK